MAILSVFSRLAALFGVLMLFSSCSNQPQAPTDWTRGDYAPVIRYLEDSLQAELDIGDIVGLSVALIDDQQLVWQQGFGYSDLDLDTNTDINSRYRAGILTQMLTATAIMQLVEQGKVTLDQPLVELLPEFTINSRFVSSKPITLRNLLSHHSGLPANVLGDRDLAFNQMLPALQSMYTSFPPNLLQANSNIGYSLLGQVIEKVSGQSYQDYMAAHLFAPLQMNNSSLEVNFSGGAYKRGESVTEPPLRYIPAAGWVTSVGDIAEFTKFIHRRGDGLLQHNSVEELLRVQNSDRAMDLGNKAGLGWRNFERVLPSAIQVLGKAGATYAHRAIILTSPTHKFSVVLMANTAEASDSLKLMATDAMRYGLAAQNGTYPDYYRPQHTQRANPVRLTSQQLVDQLPGDYASIAGLIQIEKSQRGDLSMRTLGQKLNLIQSGESSVRPELSYFGLSVNLGDYSIMDIYPQTLAGRELLIGDVEGEKTLLGEKINVASYPSSLQKFFGRWVPTEPAATVWVQIKGIEIHEKSGYLTSSLSTGSGSELHYPLQALDANTAVALGVGQKLGEYFQFYYQQGQPRLNYSGLVFRPDSELLVKLD